MIVKNKAALVRRGPSLASDVVGELRLHAGHGALHDAHDLLRPHVRVGLLRQRRERARELLAEHALLVRGLGGDLREAL